MAYGLRYYGEFKNRYNELFRVEILKKDYAGASTEVKMGATPLILSYPGDDRDMFKPIFGSETKITMLGEQQFSFTELHTGDSRGFRVDIYKDGSLWWKGWILPDLFTEPYIAPPYYVTVTARCGLGELKEKEFEDTINRLPRGVGEIPVATTQPDLYSVIANGLLSIDTDLKLNEAINVYYGTNDDTDVSPIANAKINLSAYEGKSVYEAIADICVSFGARLYQQDGEWWLVRVAEYEQNLTVRQWTISATAQNTFTIDTTKLTTFQIGRPVNSDILPSGMLDILPAWKETEFEQTLGLRGNLVENGDFSEFNVPFDKQDQYGNTYQVKPIKDWEYTPDSSGGDPSVRIDQDGSTYCYLRDTDGITQVIADVKEGDYIPDVPLAPRSQKLRFALDYTLLAQFTEPIYRLNITIKIKGASETKYLKKVFEDSQAIIYDWVDTPNTIVISGIRRSEGFDSLNFNTIEILSTSIPIDGELSLSLFKGTTDFGDTEFAFFAFKNCGMFIFEDEGDFEDTVNTKVTVNSNNIYIPPINEVVGGDLPDSPNNKLIWGNGYRKASGETTQEWHERGSAEEYPLVELTMRDYKEFFFQPQFKLSLPIMSQNIKFDSSIVDYQILPNKYICNVANLDVRRGVFSGTFIHYAAWEGGNWILEDGTWNDNGIWIDEETWNDSDPFP